VKIIDKVVQYQKFNVMYGQLGGFNNY